MHKARAPLRLDDHRSFYIASPREQQHIETDRPNLSHTFQGAFVKFYAPWYDHPKDALRFTVLGASTDVFDPQNLFIYSGERFFFVSFVFALVKSSKHLSTPRLRRRRKTRQRHTTTIKTDHHHLPKKIIPTMVVPKTQVRALQSAETSLGQTRRRIRRFVHGLDRRRRLYGAPKLVPKVRRARLPDLEVFHGEPDG